MKHMKQTFKYLLLIMMLLNAGCVFYSTRPNEAGVRTKKLL